ncbi:glycosyltransferase family 2 protein [Thermicanus aegyptius]|uniref:glycosyltransferase family 2 protein n=1 Tax=Thermicanus aegyptius TaxID=94009 RepID=UPI00034948A3|nr:glycosyltransferase [Thermicanus aegyptius]
MKKKGSPPSIRGHKSLVTSIWNSTEPLVSVIIPVQNERDRIEGVIWNARMIHPSTEVIVVANGTTDGSHQVAERMGAKVLYYPYVLGHDVGRSVGSQQARGEILLFLDGDLPLPFRLLRPFVKAVMDGADLALNGFVAPDQRRRVHPVVLSKYALNIILNRPDLKGASMTAVPHALNRRALLEIGHENLSVPPKALAIAIEQGLRIETIANIPIERWNRKRGKRPWMRELVVGDHLEAIHWFLQRKGNRGGYWDGMRVREAVFMPADQEGEIMTVHGEGRMGEEERIGEREIINRGEFDPTISVEKETESEDALNVNLE